MIGHQSQAKLQLSEVKTVLFEVYSVHLLCQVRGTRQKQYLWEGVMIFLSQRMRDTPIDGFLWKGVCLCRVCATRRKASCSVAEILKY